MQHTVNFKDLPVQRSTPSPELNHATAGLRLITDHWQIVRMTPAFKTAPINGFDQASAITGVEGIDLTAESFQRRDRSATIRTFIRVREHKGRVVVPNFAFKHTTMTVNVWKGDCIVETYEFCGHPHGAGTLADQLERLKHTHLRQLDKLFRQGTVRERTRREHGMKLAS